MSSAQISSTYPPISIFGRNHLSRASLNRAMESCAKSKIKLSERGGKGRRYKNIGNVTGSDVTRSRCEDGTTAHCKWQRERQLHLRRRGFWCITIINNYDWFSIVILVVGIIQIYSNSTASYVHAPRRLLHCHTAARYTTLWYCIYKLLVVAPCPPTWQATTALCGTVDTVDMGFSFYKLCTMSLSYPFLCFSLRVLHE